MRRPEAQRQESAVARRILFVSRTWAMGGAQSILLTLIKSLPRDRFEIVVAPFETGEAADAMFTKAATAAGAVVTSPIPWHGMTSWNAALDALSRAVDEARAELIHSHENMSNTLVGLNRRRLVVPAVATAFGWWSLNLKLRSYYAVERRLVLPRFDAVYTVSNAMAAKIRRGGTPAERIAVVHTGLDAEVWAPRGRRQAVRRSLGLSDGELAMGSVGRISREKGLDFLLKAAAQLLHRMPNLRLVLAGTGPDLERIKLLAAKLKLERHLVMPGYVADPPAVLEALDLAVLPSVLEEGFPTAALEAQAVGLPLVASDIGGTRETLIEGKTGFLCPPGDVEKLTSAIWPLLEDRQLRLTMGAAARQHVATRFPLSAMLEGIGELYDGVLDADRPRPAASVS